MLNCLRLKIFEFDVMNQLKSFFQEGNIQGRKDSYQKRHFPNLCSHSFSDRPTHTKTVDKKSGNEQSGQSSHGC